MGVLDDRVAVFVWIVVVIVSVAPLGAESHPPTACGGRIASVQPSRWPPGCTARAPRDARAGMPATTVVGSDSFCAASWAVTRSYSSSLGHCFLSAARDPEPHHVGHGSAAAGSPAPTRTAGAGRTPRRDWLAVPCIPRRSGGASRHRPSRRRRCPCAPLARSSTSHPSGLPRPA